MTGTPLRVVVVDDNVDGADTLADLLGLLGHQVRVAYDGPSGLGAVRAFDPDVVLLDIGLPGMNGYEVARRLRTDEAGRPVLIAVTKSVTLVAPTSSLTVWSPASVKVGASFTAVTLIANVCGADVSVPPPLSERVSVIVADPLAFAARV